MGELGCSYADGCLTAEETVLFAYWRGRCVQEGKLPPGAMAAVGLSWEDAKKRCKNGVVAACHNSADSVTVSGPAEDVRKNMIINYNDFLILIRFCQFSDSSVNK